MKLIAYAQAHGLRLFAALALAALTLALACFNVQGWLAAQLALLAILAACFEAIGFVFAVLTEDAARAGRWDRAAVCFLILVGAAAFNTVGGHRAWEESQRPQAEADQRAAQRGLDARRAELQLAAARAQAEIDRAPMPRPEQTPQRQAEARATWELATAEPRRRQAQAEATLARLPVVAAAPAPAFGPRLTWGFLAFLEVAKALGLWAIGISSAAAPARQPQAWKLGGLDASEAARRLVAMRRDRQPLPAAA